MVGCVFEGSLVFVCVVIFTMKYCLISFSNIFKSLGDT